MIGNNGQCEISKLCGCGEQKTQGWLAADGVSAELDPSQLTVVMCDHIELAAATTQTACRLQQQHGPAVRRGVVDACDSTLRSTRSDKNIILHFMFVGA